MTRGDRRGRYADEDARRRPASEGWRESDEPRDRYAERGTARSNGRAAPRGARDDRYDDRYDERGAPRSGRGGGAGFPARGNGNAGPDDRGRARSRSRNGYDDDFPRRRAAGSQGAGGRAGYGRAAGARANEWERNQPRKKSRRGVLLVSLALVLLVLPPVLVLGVWPRVQGLFGTQANTLFPWAGSTQLTAVNPDNSAFGAQKDPVDPAFQAYYTAHAGATSLGTPLTPGFLTSAGIVQVYAYGALLAPGIPSGPAASATPAATASSGTPGASTPATTPTTAAPTPSKTTTGTAGSSLGDTVLRLLGTGPALSTPTASTPTTAPGGASTVVSLPVIAALLKTGSQAPVTDGASMTYVDLRRAAMPDQLVPGSAPSAPPTATPSQPVFVATDTQGGRAQGHTIPPALWTYITRPDVSPAGWQTDIGAPLTEAQTLTVTQAGATHHLMIQAFWHAVLIADADSLGGAQPAIARASIGLHYLLTLGPPSLGAPAHTTVWALGAAAVLDAPVTGKETVHIGPNFPLTLSGEAKWNQAALWFAVSWSSGTKGNGKGWLAGSALTFSPPDPSQPGQASFDVLAPDLATYLAGQGKNMGVGVYDLTRNAYYGYNDTQTYVLASTAKVYIMASYLDWLEGQGRGPRSDEVASLTRMIENSNNDDAQLLYDRVGGSSGQQQFLQKVGITDYARCGYGWGCAQLSPADAVHILTLLQQGKILNDSDRKLAFNLMGNVESDMRWGVGDTAPHGATFYMKDGWLQYPADPWDLNSVGIVTLGNETYVIAVYSQNNPSFDWSKVQHVCGAVAQALTG